MAVLFYSISTSAWSRYFLHYPLHSHLPRHGSDYDSKLGRDYYATGGFKLQSPLKINGALPIGGGRTDWECPYRNHSYGPIQTEHTTEAVQRRRWYRIADALRSLQWRCRSTTNRLVQGQGPQERAKMAKLQEGTSEYLEQRWDSTTRAATSKLQEPTQPTHSNRNAVRIALCFSITLT